MITQGRPQFHLPPLLWQEFRRARRRNAKQQGNGTVIYRREGLSEGRQAAIHSQEKKKIREQGLSIQFRLLPVNGQIKPGLGRHALSNQLLDFYSAARAAPIISCTAVLKVKTTGTGCQP